MKRPSLGAVAGKALPAAPHHCFPLPSPASHSRPTYSLIQGDRSDPIARSTPASAPARSFALLRTRGNSSRMTENASTYAVQCCVDEQHIRSFRAMLICLDRFGKELFLEVNHAEVNLRTLNQAQSAFVVFTLKAAFFAEYLVDAAATTSVKLHLKNLVSIFRTTNGINRVWLQLACNDEDSQSYVRVQLQCASGVRKKFDIALKEVTPMSAVYSRDTCPHRIVADPSKIISCLSNFPSNLPEVTLVATADRLLLKNDADCGGGSEKEDASLRTEMTLPASDLDHYELSIPLLRGGELPVSFSLKEFRAMLQLLRDIDHRLVIHVEGTGKPLIFTSEPRQDFPLKFSMECVLATVVDEQNLGDDDLFGDEFDAFQPAAVPQSAASLDPQSTRPPPQPQASWQHASPTSSFCHSHPAPLPSEAHGSFYNQPHAQAPYMDSCGSFGGAWGGRGACASQPMAYPPHHQQQGAMHHFPPSQGQLSQQAPVQHHSQPSLSQSLPDFPHLSHPDPRPSQQVGRRPGTPPLGDACNSDTEEEEGVLGTPPEDAVPGTPPGSCSPACKRIRAESSLMCH
ncbi:hypothetical protein AB1Y20_009222 [Prymnesium parvum]|uniref:Cell cycle checkpoint control protein RAD9A n=1 Tax=Prymnesium parvum TaxID=97485 RepID=A0AB34K384_PRYPA